MTVCLAITNGICSVTVKNSRNFSQILGLSIKALLSLCNDDESDVRTVADECLNKVIRVSFQFIFFFPTFYKKAMVFIIFFFYCTVNVRFECFEDSI